MNVGYLFKFLVLGTLLAFTTEVPIEGSTLPPEPDIIVNHPHGSHEISDERNKERYGLSDGENGRYIPGEERFNYSRMLRLTTTTEVYDEWWFLSTKKPKLSLKEDFPGRPGVATWREISSGSSSDNRKDRKSTSPTAASVSSGSWSTKSNPHFAEIIWKGFWLIFLLFCLCWT